MTDMADVAGAPLSGGYEMLLHRMLTTDFNGATRVTAADISAPTSNVKLQSLPPRPAPPPAPAPTLPGNLPTAHLFDLAVDLALQDDDEEDERSEPFDGRMAHDAALLDISDYWQEGHPPRGPEVFARPSWI